MGNLITQPNIEIRCLEDNKKDKSNQKLCWSKSLLSDIKDKFGTCRGIFNLYLSHDGYTYKLANLDSVNDNNVKDYVELYHELNYSDTDKTKEVTEIHDFAIIHDIILSKTYQLKRLDKVSSKRKLLGRSKLSKIESALENLI